MGANSGAIAHYEALIGTRFPRRVPLGLVRRLLRASGAGASLNIRPLGSDLSGSVSEAQSGAFLDAVASGSSALLTSFARGEWWADDLYGVMQALLDFEHRVLTYRGWLPTARRRRAPKRMADVALHYDLPKDLFAAVVSANSYSATRHRLAPDHPVEAHRRHYRAILQEVLPDGGHILDLGCGWGGLLDVALEDDRNSVAAVTISGAQAQAVELGHADEIARNRLRLVNGDFTQLDLLPTKVDALAMIESIEHLGPALRTPFLRDLRDRYPGAPLVVQATTKAGRGAEARSRERGALVDVVFPGPGMLPTVRQLRRELIAARYELIRTYDLTSEYVSTALRWMQGFGSEADEGGDVAPIARLFQAYAAATAASLDRGMARNVVIISRPKER